MHKLNNLEEGEIAPKTTKSLNKKRKDKATLTTIRQLVIDLGQADRGPVIDNEGFTNVSGKKCARLAGHAQANTKLI